MPKVLEENTSIIQEVCLHHLSEKHKNPNCATCSPNYDSRKHPNNYDCPDYDPQLQIDYDKLIKKIEEKYRNLLPKEKKEIKIFVNVMNCGLINCNGHKINLEEIIENIRSHLKANFHLINNNI